MRIAILGATSQIAKDLISSILAETQHELSLFARRPEAVSEWLKSFKVKEIDGFECFSKKGDEFDAVINFVGSGNPALTARMGSSILGITHQFDNLALSHVIRYPNCRYIFLSSGAAYGGDFDLPVNEDTKSVFSLNNLKASDWYGVSKMYAECLHRSLTNLPIVDIRVFNYFSYSSDINSSFLITDMLRSFRANEIFKTSSSNIVRDYFGPREFFKLISCVLSAPPNNVAVDCITKRPVDKISLLKAMSSELGLQFELVSQQTGLTATGNKVNYYSKSHKAADLFGFVAGLTAMEIVVEQSKKLLNLVSPD